MSFSPAIRDFIDNLCGLPGIGSRTAQRIALHLLANQRQLGHKISDSLKLALEQVKECQRCRNFSEEELCGICQDDKRVKQLCIVESSLDVWAVEQSGSYSGYYFVLHGHISPIDDIGPDQLGLDKLKNLVDKIEFDEIILATNPTVEGEITAHYIQKKLQPVNLKMTRIAHGVPMGGELEYIDGGTLARAFIGRTNYLEGENNN
ncbi:MAG: recombination protein RecR [Candidatus Portiera sp.]|nr:recombination protein RecR [Portiera sp.]